MQETSNENTLIFFIIAVSYGIRCKAAQPTSANIIEDARMNHWILANAEDCLFDIIHKSLGNIRSRLFEIIKSRRSQILPEQWMEFNLHKYCP